MCGALRDAAKNAEKLRLESERALLRKLGRDEGDGQQYCDEDMKGQLKYSAASLAAALKIYPELAEGGADGNSTCCSEEEVGISPPSSQEDAPVC